MALTKRRIVTGLSVVYLLALTILAAYALHSTRTYRLPIHNSITALTIALPPLAGVALESILSLDEKLAQKGELQTSRIFQIVVTFFLIYETVLATLAGTHISPPGSLTCALRETWQTLYKSKEDGPIRTIQDTFECCGFQSPLDMAWPFTDANHGSDACVVRFDRLQACVDPWRSEERKVAIMLLVVPLAVFVWKIAILLSPSSQSSWLPSHLRLVSENVSESANRRPRPGLGYRDLEDNAEDDSLHREVTNLNKDSALATHIEGNRSRVKGPLNETHARQERHGES